MNITTKRDRATPIRLVLHPGFSKCGSSAIQSFLHSNTRALRKKGIFLLNRNLNFYHPWSFKALVDTRYLAHHLRAKIKGERHDPLYQVPISYFQNIIHNQDTQDLASHLKRAIKQAQIARCHTLLISAENLSGPINTVEQLHRVLGTSFQSVRVIFYIRRQDEWLASSWQQWGYKQGYCLAETVAAFLHSGIPNYLALAHLFEEIYGGSNLEVVPLCKEALWQEDLILDFCKRANIETTGLDFSNIYANHSLNPHLCEMLAQMPHIYAHQDIHDNALRNLLEAMAPSNSLLLSNDRHYMPAALRSRIADTFAAENRQLLARYCPQLSAKTLTPMPPSDVEESAHQRATTHHDEVVVRIQMELLLEICQRQQRQAVFIRLAIALASLSLAGAIILLFR